MKRHPSLRDLSVDHHHALVQAHRLQRAASVDEVTRWKIISEFLAFWQQDGQRHFCEEEQVLLPFFARWGEVNQEPIHQMLREHVLIRSGVSRLEADATANLDICKTLGVQLEGHVRLEERVVFPLIEAALPGDAMPELERRLSEFQAQYTQVPPVQVQRATEDKPLPADHNQPHQRITNMESATHMVSTLPGANLQSHKMPGHWLLARLGKKVLRPGGLELTRHLLQALDIGSCDNVVEFAPGMGATAQMTLERNPASYTAVERDEAAANNIRQLLDGPNREFRIGSADDTGLPDASASVVYGEAMLTMQTADMKERIVREAARLLQPGGRYGIHELCLVPDDASDEIEQEIMRALSGSIHVGARPLRVREWRALLEGAGLTVVAEQRVPMELLEPARLVADEGLNGALQIVWNALHDAEALARVREMRAVFRKYHNHLEAIALVGMKKG